MIKEGRRLFVFIAVTIVSLLIGVIIAFYVFSKWEEKLIEERMMLCISNAREITETIQSDSLSMYSMKEFDRTCVKKDSLKSVEKYLSEVVGSILKKVHGLEGGLYLSMQDEFIAYSFPTSPPPIPVYGPPPRSHKIIKEQILLSINSKEDLVNVHAFDPAVFPLASVPVFFENTIIGAVWVRVHIERELPVSRLRRIVNLGTMVLLFGFVFMAILSLFFRNGIKNIQKEFRNTRENPDFRLKRRGGLFGFIPASINSMLDTIQEESEERIELEKRLQQKEKMATLGKMVAGVAHEVKTPLSVVKMRVQMWEKEILKDDSLNDKISNDSLKLVLDEIDRLTQLVNRLVFFSRPIHKNIKSTNIVQLTEEVFHVVKMTNESSNIKFVLKAKEETPSIDIDANAIRQVLLNVLNNAVESMGTNGELLLKIIHNNISEEIAIEVYDTGIGIPIDQLDQIYDPFFTTKEHGTGLGLSISHEIVGAHQGSISYENMESGGVKCCITLPIKQNLRLNGK